MPEDTNAQPDAQPARRGYMSRARQYMKDLAGRTPDWVKYAAASTLTTVLALYVNNNWSLQRLSNVNVRSVEVRRDVNNDGRVDVRLRRYIGSDSTYLTNADGSTTLEDHAR
ncbi:hypothetical protein HY489_04930 [Candidatus Woesearchaeota archaeon]|nr:hypothetical protein [Candidatus Woesearchaeota archaeon]